MFCFSGYIKPERYTHIQLLLPTVHPSLFKSIWKTVAATSPIMPGENAIRPFTIGRKNWLFSQSMGSVRASAVVYTMVEMAKTHSLNIYEYLKYVLEQRPNSI